MHYVLRAHFSCRHSNVRGKRWWRFKLWIARIWNPFCAFAATSCDFGDLRWRSHKSLFFRSFILDTPFRHTWININLQLFLNKNNDALLTRWRFDQLLVLWIDKMDALSFFVCSPSCRISNTHFFIYFKMTLLISALNNWKVCNDRIPCQSTFAWQTDME